MKVQAIYLEHANITVSDLQEAIRFFQTAFPHFRIRGGGNDMREWVHLGDDNTYVALNQAKENALKTNKNYDKIGINHLGFVVEDVAHIARDLLRAGYQRDYPKQVEQFRIRDYFADTDGNQYEFVQYLSEAVHEKNSYDRVTE
ncbi:VOC family protein [Spongiimicrobium salis]|uniref:VOC family protein n=1 Tax=Spongiimicrobium salis TaxID=1667022 RepID=UPI00374DC410